MEVALVTLVAAGITAGIGGGVAVCIHFSRRLNTLGDRVAANATAIAVNTTAIAVNTKAIEALGKEVAALGKEVAATREAVLESERRTRDLLIAMFPHLAPVAAGEGPVPSKPLDANAAVPAEGATPTGSAEGAEAAIADDSDVPAGDTTPADAKDPAVPADAA